MNLPERAGLWALHKIDPERAHAVSLLALKLGLVRLPGVVTSPRLATSIAGIRLPNPIGLAAGYDKNAYAIAPLLRSGFGFVEVGAATPRPQTGNAKPRLFRLTQDRAAINRFGFNNQGAAAVAARLAKRPATGVVGLNLGANKDSADRAQDFVQVLETCAPYIDFATVNVSSPNTEKLRDLQGADALRALLDRVIKSRDALPRPIPIFVKIAPDLTVAELDDIARVALQTGIDAVIATNTTLARDGLVSRDKTQTGGLSGAPLFDRSTRILGLLAQRLDQNIPLIGVGGVSDASQAYAKIKAGASAVQLYTAMVFQGIGLAAEIARGLDGLLAQDGFTNVSQAVGTEMDQYQ